MRTILFHNAFSVRSTSDHSQNPNPIRFPFSSPSITPKILILADLFSILLQCPFSPSPITPKTVIVRRSHLHLLSRDPPLQPQNPSSNPNPNSTTSFVITPSALSLNFHKPASIHIEAYAAAATARGDNHGEAVRRWRWDTDELPRSVGARVKSFVV